MSLSAYRALLAEAVRELGERLATTRLGDRIKQQTKDAENLLHFELHARRELLIHQLEWLRELRLATEIAEALVLHTARYGQKPALSFAEIGDALHITRQSARLRAPLAATTTEELVSALASANGKLSIELKGHVAGLDRTGRASATTDSGLSRRSDSGPKDRSRSSSTPTALGGTSGTPS